MWIVKTQAEVADFFSVSLQTVGLWRASGMPGSPKNYDLSEILVWLRTSGPWSRNNSRQQSLTDSNGEFSDAARKFRSEANILEMKEQLMAGDLVKAHDVRSYMSRIADAIRTLGEDLGRSPMPIAGADVQQRINDTIESVEWDLT